MSIAGFDEYIDIDEIDMDEVRNQECSDEEDDEPSCYDVLTPFDRDMLTQKDFM